MEYEKLIYLCIKHNLLKNIKNTEITEKDVLFEGVFHGNLDLLIDLIEDSNDKKKFANDIIEIMLYSNIRHKNELKVIKTINEKYKLNFKPSALHISKWFERSMNNFSKPNYKLFDYLNKLTSEKYNDNLYSLFLAKNSRNKNLIKYVVNKNKDRKILEEKVESVLVYSQHIDDDLNYIIFNAFKKHINVKEYIKKLKIYKRFDLLEKIAIENIETIKNDNTDPIKQYFFIKDYLLNISYGKKDIEYYKFLKNNSLINADIEESILFSLSELRDTDNIVLFIKELGVDKNKRYIKHLFDYLYKVNDVDEYKKIEHLHDGTYEYCSHIYARTYLQNKRSEIFQYAITKEKKENLEKLLEDNPDENKKTNSNFEKMLLTEILKKGNITKKIKI